MGKLPWSARVFIVTVYGMATLLLAGGSLYLELPRDIPDLVLLLALLLVSLFSDIHHVHLYYKVEVTLSAAANFAAVLVLGPFISMWVAASGGLLADLFMRKSWYKSLFNAALVVLSAGLSGSAYWALGGQRSAPLDSPGNALAIVVAGIVYLSINTSLLSVVIGLVDGHNPIGVAKANLKGATFQLITLMPLGTLVAIVYHQTPWGLILLAFPVLLARYSFESYEKLRLQSQRTIELLADAIDKRDRYTFQHSEKVAFYVELICKELRLDVHDQRLSIFAARVHDLGKIGIDTSILLKPGSLSAKERAEIEQHPQIGAGIVGDLALYGEIKDLVACHQERFDGKGYPKGLKGESIPFGARIIAVADSFDAMTSDRPYRKALPLQVAKAELQKGRGTQFDPVVVDAFVSVMGREFEEELGRKQTAPEGVLS